MIIKFSVQKKTNFNYFIIREKYNNFFPILTYYFVILKSNIIKKNKFFKKSLNSNEIRFIKKNYFKTLKIPIIQKTNQNINFYPNYNSIIFNIFETKFPKIYLSSTIINFPKKIQTLILWNKLTIPNKKNLTNIKSFNNLVEKISSISDWDKLFEFSENDSFFGNLSIIFKPSYLNNFKLTRNLNNIFYQTYSMFDFFTGQNLTIKLKKKPNLQKIIQFEILSFGANILSEYIDPKLLLNIYYYNLIHFYNQTISTKLSFMKIQNILLISILNKYIMNKIYLPSIYFELIIKKMCSCVEILESSNSCFFSGDLIDFNKINEINKARQLCGYSKIIFKPILLGLTKSILATNTFLSSLSFQTTIKNLGKAALEVKTDWLTDLKSNIIVSDLLPVGSGWLRHFSKKNLSTDYY